MERIADAVNDAPTGNVISGPEMQVRDLMEELRRKAFEAGVQMRIDSHESTFSPSQGCRGQAPTKQGTLEPQHVDGQRQDQLVAKTLCRGKRGKRQSGGQADR
jgi:hypothetical protein